MKLIYCGGPYRAETVWRRQGNIRRARELALDVMRLGAMAHSPHGNTADMDGELPDEFFLAGDLEILRRCDAMIVTDDWVLSRGTRDEVAFAEAHGIPVFLSLMDLAFWLNAAELAT